MADTHPARPSGGDPVDELVDELRRSDPKSAARRLAGGPVEGAAAALSRLHAPLVLDILDQLPPERRREVLAAADQDQAGQWQVNASHPRDSLGRLMELPAAVFRRDTTVAAAVEALREQVKRRFITYLYVEDDDGRLVGLVVMRELVLAERTAKLSEIMLPDPFTFTPDMPVETAMKKAVGLHFPVYPVCEDGRLVGLVRGDDMFEQNMVSVVVQAGSMVGVEKEERITTSLSRSLRMRHPWLLLNLATAVMAGLVVSLFEDTINQVVVLAAFLPVLAGQSGNTGCQALAVTLRGMTLGDLAQRKTLAVVSKEAMLGLLNGAIIGLVAGVLMFFYAQSNGTENPAMLAFVVWMAMTGSCVASGVSGTLTPIALKRLGADPATASSIFLTTATDIVSMGLLLGLASLLVL